MLFFLTHHPHTHTHRLSHANTHAHTDHTRTQHTHTHIITHAYTHHTRRQRLRSLSLSLDPSLFSPFSILPHTHTEISPSLFSLLPHTRTETSPFVIVIVSHTHAQRPRPSPLAPRHRLHRRSRSLNVKVSRAPQIQAI